MIVVAEGGGWEQWGEMGGRDETAQASTYKINVQRCNVQHGDYC